MRCYWEHLGEHISTNKRTPKKNSPPRKPKRNKLDPLQGMLSLLIGHMKNYGPKTVGTIFNLVSVHQPQMEEKVEDGCIFDRPNNGYQLIGYSTEYSIDVER